MSVRLPKMASRTERKAPKEAREYAAGHLGKVMVKIRDSVKKAKTRIFTLLRDPKKRKEVLQPVKEQARQSVLAQLKAANTKADQGETRKKKPVVKKKIGGYNTCQN